MSTHSRRLVLTEERNAYQARLDELRIKKARFGYSTPAEVDTEIDEIDLKLTQLDASIKAIETVQELSSNDVIDQRNNSDFRLHIMVATVQATVGELANIKKYVHDEIADQNSKLKYISIAFVVLEIVRAAAPYVLRTLGWG